MPHMTIPYVENSVKIPLGEELISKFGDWLRNVRKLKDSNTIRNYVRYVRKYGHILNMQKMERLKILMSMKPRLRGWVLDAFGNYGKFLDDFMGDLNEDFSYYDLIRRLLKGIKRERVITLPKVPSFNDLVKFYKCISDERVRIYFLFRIFSGLRHKDLQLVTIDKFKVIDDVAVAWIGKLEHHKRSMFCIVPVEVLESARSLGIVKVTMKKIRLHESWKETSIRSGIPIKPSDLRKFTATYLITRGLSREDVDLIQGRSIRSIVAYTHYIELKRYVEESLIRKYREAVEPLLSLFGLKL